ncbi:iron-containing alcohol dehydrogenase family protein [Bacillus sp. T33-2]|uniref:iron-containing alcohol dehydrogenase family protein n=1 Tax=Bacillus sp. T33-2 TaxID=2054168 RepID=UPI000C789276|nr:iron-containing alcohol dehydrogenase family protein [Bacillus sp. T33-2]PLR96803.1 oxidoreductase [Bacillus sp. T33-2]
MHGIEVRGAPSFYACEPGILDKREDLLASGNITNCLVVHGEKSWEAVKPYFPEKTNKLGFTFQRYNGEVTLAEIGRISKLAKAGHFDAIVGIGGGKVLDLVKAAGHESQLDVVLIPTLASTCAAWTPLSVIYDENGQFTHYTIFPRSSLYVLFEPRAVLASPVRYFIAGIADTLAKWYEAHCIIRQLPENPLVVEIAHQTARLCKEVLLQTGEQAVNDLTEQQLTPALIKVLETNIAAGGMVGGFGDSYARIAGAHAIHNGLTTQKETHHLLHGEKVAYGILVQLAMEHQWHEIKKLIPFYRSLNLPVSLDDIGFKHSDVEKLMAVAEAATVPGESIHSMEGDMTAEHVFQTLLSLDRVVQQS